MTFAQRRNRLSTNFSERILVVKRLISVMGYDTAHQIGRNLLTFRRDLLRQDLKAASVVSFIAVRKLYQFIRRQFHRQYCSSWHVFEDVYLQSCGPSAFVTILQNVQRIELVRNVKIRTSGSAFFEFSTGISTVRTGRFIVAFISPRKQTPRHCIEFVPYFVLTYLFQFSYCNSNQLTLP